MSRFARVVVLGAVARAQGPSGAVYRPGTRLPANRALELKAGDPLTLRLTPCERHLAQQAAHSREPCSIGVTEVEADLTRNA